MVDEKQFHVRIIFDKEILKLKSFDFKENIDFGLLESYFTSELITDDLKLK